MKRIWDYLTAGNRQDQLSALEGETFTVKGLDGFEDMEKKKLYAMGFVPGVRIKLIRALTSSDMLVLEVAGATVALAKSAWANVKMVHEKGESHA